MGKIMNIEIANNNYSVGAYIRLSREDDDKNIESESIKNQKTLIIQYAKENNLNIVRTYIDDGYSGTNFDRPNFKKLINDIESKKINMVITKDLSRLGRDYIGTGNLIEKYFPEKGIRYIAITDNIDTLLDSSNNDIAPFKAIMNDMYAKDISKKIRSSLRAKQKEGKWVGSRAPFGYEKDPNNKNHLIINKFKADIVRRIYNMFLNNQTIHSIADTLTKEGIKTPSQYYSNNLKYSNINYGIWNSKTIKDILTNRTYTGDLVQNKRNKVNYKIKTVINNNPNNYIVVENTHDPIIKKELFYEVQKRIPKNIGRIEKKENNLFDGLLYCGDCGHRISIMPKRKIDNNHYTICNYYRTHIKQRACSMHSNNYDKLEERILTALRPIYKKNINKNNIKNKVKERFKSVITLHENEKTKVQYEINKINNQLDELYLDKLDKKIGDDQFQRIKKRLEVNLDSEKKKFNNINYILNHNENKYEKIIESYIDYFFNTPVPPREFIVSIIDKIELYEDKNINIIVCFSNNNIT